MGTDWIDIQISKFPRARKLEIWCEMWGAKSKVFGDEELRWLLLAPACDVVF
jgi:hypothetical protein